MNCVHTIEMWKIQCQPILDWTYDVPAFLDVSFPAKMDDPSQSTLHVLLLPTSLTVSIHPCKSGIPKKSLTPLTNPWMFLTHKKLLKNSHIFGGPWWWHWDWRIPTELLRFIILKTCWNNTNLCYPGTVLGHQISCYTRCTRKIQKFKGQKPLLAVATGTHDT